MNLIPREQRLRLEDLHTVIIRIIAERWLHYHFPRCTCPPVSEDRNVELRVDDNPMWVVRRNVTQLTLGT